MHHFQYKNGTLFCEQKSIPEIAQAVGTPFYLYSAATITRHFRAFDEAFDQVPHLVCFSAKANSNRAVLHLLGKLGCGLDIVSGGELFRGLAAGMPAQRMVYSGVGKTIEEMDYALASGILMFNVESMEELILINARAAELGKRAPVAMRINPDVDPQTHPYISTGLKKNKFGINKAAAVGAYHEACKLSHVDILGVDFHIGSQIVSVEPFVEAVESVLDLVCELENMGISIRYLDVGGGLGIPYSDESPPQPRQYAKAICNALGDRAMTVILEPGRAIVGNAGVLVTRVLHLKKGDSKKFVICDAGMNDLIRPSMYDAYHAIQPLVRRPGEPFTADVVGPICESGDFFAKNRKIDPVLPGDLLAVMSAGAYGFSMASNYNSRPRPAEVMVSGERFQVVRERESLEDLVRGERVME